MDRMAFRPNGNPTSLAELLTERGYVPLGQRSDPPWCTFAVTKQALPGVAAL